MLTAFASSLRCPIDVSFQKDDQEEEYESSFREVRASALNSMSSSAIIHSVVPGAVESLCSEPSCCSPTNTATDTSDSAVSLKKEMKSLVLSPLSGTVSPSGVCKTRRNSTVLTVTPDFEHPVLVSRPATLLPPPANTHGSQIDGNQIEEDKMDTTSITISSQGSLSFKGASCVLESLDDDEVVLDQSHLPASIDPKLINGNISASFSFDSWGTREGSESKWPPQIHQVQDEPNPDPQRDPSSYCVRSAPPPLRNEAWSEVSAETFPVRGPLYHIDNKKSPSQPSALQLFAVDLIRCKETVQSGICSRPGERIQTALRREKETGLPQMPKFVFAVNLCIPGSSIYHNVFYFGTDDVDEIENQTTPFGRLMHRFIHDEDDQFRNQTFKLIPRISSGGNFLVRNAVGSKPTLLGKSLKQTFFRTDRFVEVMVDIASDAIAQRIVKLVLGYAKSITVDMMFLLEGTDEETLPERILGGVQLNRIDFKNEDGNRELL